MSLALWNTAVYGAALRGLAVGYAAAHPEEYSCFLGDDWQAYLRWVPVEMGEWRAGREPGRLLDGCLLLPTGYPSPPRSHQPAVL
jgi:hypothetical protein